MLRPLPLRLLALATLLALALLGLGRKGERVRFVLLHTNDLHGQMLPREVRRGDSGETVRVGGFATIGAYVRRTREEAKASGSEVLLVDAGDWYQGTPEGSRTRGAAVVEWMNAVGFDAAAAGNHEFDHGLENFSRLLGLARFPVLGANVFDRRKGKLFPGLRAHAVVARRGIRLAFVGLLTHLAPELTTASVGEELRFEEEKGVVREAVAAARGEADQVFLLTHCGVESDRALAALVPEVPAILGGHSHTRLETPVAVGRTRVLQTGAKGEAIGRVDFEVDAGTKEILSLEARLEDLSPAKEGEDAVSAEIVRREEAAVRAAMEERVGELLGDLGKAPGLGSSPAGNLVADATREAGGAEIGFANEGGVRAPLLGGAVTRRSFFELVPFENTVVVLSMKGSEVEEALRASLRREGRTPLEVSGLVVRWRRTEGGGGDFLGATCGAEPLDRARTYRVAVNSFLAGGGDGYPVFARAAERRDTGTLLRDAAVEWFRKRSPLRAAPEERFVETP